MTRLPLAGLLNDRTPIRVAEAVAIVRGLWSLRDVGPLQGDVARGLSQPRVPSFEEVKLSALGELSVHRKVRLGASGVEQTATPAPVFALGEALRTLLERSDSHTDPSSWTLWGVVDLAALPWSFDTESDSRQGTTVETFLAALEPFSPADPRAALQELFARWESGRQAGVADAAPTAPVESVTPPPLAPLRLSSDPVTPSRRAEPPAAMPTAVHAAAGAKAAGPAGTTARAKLTRRAAPAPGRPVMRSSAVVTSAAAPDSGVDAPPALAGRRLARRRVAARLLATAAGLALIAALSYGLTTSVLRASRSAQAHNTAPADAAVGAPQASALAQEAGLDAAPFGGGSENAGLPADQQQIASREDEPTLVTHQRPDVADPAAPVVPTRNSGETLLARERGQRLRLRPALPTFNGDSMYSPSFTRDGTLLFHTGTRDRGDLMRAASTGDEVTVAPLLDDDARNYHVQVSPDDQWLAFDSDREGERAVYIADRSGHRVRRVSGTGYASVPSWSPEGTRLAFARAEPNNPRVWNIWVADLHSGELRRVTSHASGQPWGASWFPDGQRIAYSRTNQLIVLNLETGEADTFRSPRRGAWIRTPAVSPEGERVVFQVYGDGAWLLDLRDRSMRRLLADRSAEEFAWTPDGQEVAFHSQRSGAWRVWVMPTSSE